MPRPPKRWVLLALRATVGLMVLLASERASAFTYIVQPGDTLAGIAERFYGRIQNEKLLVVANALDALGGTKISAGMRLEVPALTYVRIGSGHKWKDLAARLLGGKHRAHALADANDSKPWLPPPADAEIVVPYNLRFVSTGNDTIVGLAYRFLGDRRKAWMLDQYNDRKGRRLNRGDIVLLPMVDIELTEAGKQAATAARLLARKQGGGEQRAIQAQVTEELPQLTAHVRSGRYIEALKLGLSFTSRGSLTQPQRAKVHRLLLETYVALGANGLATESCRLWLKSDPEAELDPIMLSPKIVEACRRIPR